MTSILSVTDLTFRYRPSLPELFNGLTHSFNAGVTAVTGPSGRGKSTLLYILGMLLRQIWHYLLGRHRPDRAQ